MMRVCQYPLRKRNFGESNFIEKPRDDSKKKRKIDDTSVKDVTMTSSVHTERQISLMERSRKTCGGPKHRKILLRNFSEEPESSEEEDVVDEKLEETEGLKLLQRAMDSKCEN